MSQEKRKRIKAATRSYVAAAAGRKVVSEAVAVKTPSCGTEEWCRCCNGGVTPVGKAR